MASSNRQNTRRPPRTKELLKMNHPPQAASAPSSAANPAPPGRAAGALPSGITGLVPTGLIPSHVSPSRRDGGGGKSGVTSNIATPTMDLTVSESPRAATVPIGNRYPAQG